MHRFQFHKLKSASIGFYQSKYYFFWRSATDMPEYTVKYLVKFSFFYSCPVHFRHVPPPVPLWPIWWRSVKECDFVLSADSLTHSFTRRQAHVTICSMLLIYWADKNGHRDDKRPKRQNKLLKFWLWFKNFLLVKIDIASYRVRHRACYRKNMIGLHTSMAWPARARKTPQWSGDLLTRFVFHNSRGFSYYCWICAFLMLNNRLLIIHILCNHTLKNRP